jgi:hypothetical protein
MICSAQEESPERRILKKNKLCDFLTPTDAVTENPQKCFIAKKHMYYYLNRLGWRQNVLKGLKTFMLLS